MSDITKDEVLKCLEFIENYARPIYRFKGSIKTVKGYIEQQTSNKAVQTLSMLVGYSEDYCFKAYYNGDEIEIKPEVFDMPLSYIFPINEDLMEIHIDDDVVPIEDVEFKEEQEK